MNKTKKQKINEIIERWKKFDGKSYLLPDSIKTGHTLPVCPELKYRITGKWKGYNQYVGIKPGHPDYLKNLKQDKLEDEAFEIFKQFKIKRIGE